MVAGVDYDTISVTGELTTEPGWTLTLMDDGGSADPADIFYLFEDFTGHVGEVEPLLDTSMVDLSDWDISGVTFGIDATDPNNQMLFMTGLSVVPEPSTALLALIGLLGLLGCGRRRRR